MQINEFGTIVRWMGKDWVMNAEVVAHVFGVRRDTKAEQAKERDPKSKKTFKQLLEESMKKKE